MQMKIFSFLHCFPKQNCILGVFSVKIISRENEKKLVSRVSFDASHSSIWYSEYYHALWWLEPQRCSKKMVISKNLWKFFLTINENFFVFMIQLPWERQYFKFLPKMGFFKLVFSSFIKICFWLFGFFGGKVWWFH